MTLDAERHTKQIVAGMQDAEVVTAYRHSAAESFERAERLDFAATVLAKVLDNLESGAKIPLSEQDLTSLISQVASLDTIVETVSDAKDEITERAASEYRMGHDSIDMVRPQPNLTS